MFVESLSVTDKEFGTDPKWMPFKRDAHGAVLIPHETDPGGIPLFGVDGCLDPAGIKEAELRIASLGVPTKRSSSALPMRTSLNLRHSLQSPLMAGKGKDRPSTLRK